MDSFLALVPLLAKSVRSKETGEPSSDTPANKQAALLSLRVLCRNFGQAHPDAFKQVRRDLVIYPSAIGYSRFCVYTRNTTFENSAIMIHLFQDQGMEGLKSFFSHQAL